MTKLTSKQLRSANRKLKQKRKKTYISKYAQDLQKKVDPRLVKYDRSWSLS